MKGSGNGKRCGFLITLVIVSTISYSFKQLNAQDNIVIGQPGRNFSFIPFQIAEEKGFFKAHGLRVQQVQVRSDVAIAALTSGSIDYASHLNGLIRAAIHGFDLRLILSTANKQMFSLVVQPDIQNVADLKGKIIGTNAFGAFQYSITVRVLRAAGINPDKDIKWIVGNDVIFRQQLKAKKMDAALINPPLSVIMSKEGFKLLLHAGDYVDAPLTGLGTTTKKIREHPDEVKKVLRSLYQALRFVRTNKDETMKIAARWLKMDPEIATSTFRDRGKDSKPRWDAY
jgi:ABC-type nitrate/sulfonate/bicarbonate transport system substrate-binding protein